MMAMNLNTIMTLMMLIAKITKSILFLSSKSRNLNSSQQPPSSLTPEQVPLLQEEESHIFSVSADSSHAENQLISVLSSGSTSSSDS